MPGMAFARDGSGGEYHLLEDGSIGYYSSEGAAGRLAERMDCLLYTSGLQVFHQLGGQFIGHELPDLFLLIVPVRRFQGF